MISTASPIVIFGAGSIGERHIYVLQQLGYNNLAVFRQRKLPFRNIRESSVRTLTSLSEISEFKPKAAIICTPTSQHAEQALFCLERKIPVLVEKPLSHNLDCITPLRQTVEQNSALLQVAYMLRYHPLILKVKMFIEQNRYGRLVSMQSYWGEYLPDWHPWEDYRQSYAARKDMGGGAALTLSHDIDLANWMAASKLVNWHTVKNHSSDLEIDVESAADVSLIYQNGITAHCHLNFHEKTPDRWYRFVFTHATIQINYFENELIIYPSGQKSEVIHATDFQRNDMYESQVKDFLNKIEIKSRDGLTYISESEKNYKSVQVKI